MEAVIKVVPCMEAMEYAITASQDMTASTPMKHCMSVHTKKKAVAAMNAMTTDELACAGHRDEGAATATASMQPRRARQRSPPKGKGGHRGSKRTKKMGGRDFRARKPQGRGRGGGGRRRRQGS